MYISRLNQCLALFNVSVRSCHAISQGDSLSRCISSFFISLGGCVFKALSIRVFSFWLFSTSRKKKTTYSVPVSFYLFPLPLSLPIHLLMVVMCSRRYQFVSSSWSVSTSYKKESQLLSTCSLFSTSISACQHFETPLLLGRRALKALLISCAQVLAILHFK